MKLEPSNYAVAEQLERHGRLLEIAGETVPFEIFAESHDPPLDDLFDGLE